MPAGDVFGLDGFFLNKSNPITVSAVDINSTAAGAGITVVSGVLNAAAGIATLTLSTAAGLSTTPFYVGAKIAVSGLGTAGVAYTGYNGNFVVTGFAGTTTVSYATTGYVGSVTAGITTTGLVMLVTDTAVTNTTWSGTQTHGWFGGGSPSTISRVDRIDFSNDTGTANIRGSLSQTTFYDAATGNSNYGWFGGGEVDRIDFSNDSATASLRGPLSSKRYALAATGNSNYGWFGGGYRSPTAYSTVDRIDFSNDSATASLRGPLSATRYNLAATGNSNYGWFGGGEDFATPTPVSTVERIDFSNDSATISPRSPLSLARFRPAATGNSNYGWFGGGAIPGTPFYLSFSTVDRIDFSNDSVIASVRGPLSVSTRGFAATGNSNYGWFGGGFDPLLSTVVRIDFSNDNATASPRGPLSLARSSAGATSGQARSSSVRLQKAGNYGWFGGGSTGEISPVSLIVSRIDFSNDSSTSLVRGPLSNIRYRHATTSNSNYGWSYAGGSGNTTALTTVDRIDFSNDSATASVRSLTKSYFSIFGLFYSSGVGNSNYGWIAGGNSPDRSIVERINYSNDSLVSLSRGPLTIGSERAAATGNSNYGWIAGGVPAGAPALTPGIGVDRIDFSNDSVSALARGPLSVARYALAATGNSNYGWFGGGRTPTTVATVDRIDFSNDSVTASVRGPLNSTRDSLSATGNSNYGWFGGGLFSATTKSTVERINFSNDSVAASTRGSITPATGRTELGAVSNTPA